MNAIHTPLPIFEMIKNAWSKVKGSKTTFFLVFVGFAFVSLFPINKIVPNNHLGGILSFIITFLLVSLVFIFLWGFFYLGVLRAMGIKIKLMMLRQVFKWNVILRILGFLILNFLIVSMSPLFFLFLPKILFVPSVNSSTVALNINSIMRILTAMSYILGLVVGLFTMYVALRLTLAPLLIIVKELNPWSAIKISFKATESNVCRLICVYILIFFLIIISAVFFGVGLVWSIPFGFILYGEIYRQLIHDVYQG